MVTCKEQEYMWIPPSKNWDYPAKKSDGTGKHQGPRTGKHGYLPSKHRDFASKLRNQPGFDGCPMSRNLVVTKIWMRFSSMGHLRDEHP